MRKIISALSILSITLLLIECSSDNNNEDPVLFQKVQGKWKLTEQFSDDSEINEPVEDGYEMLLKNNHTFTSNEVGGYTGGTYTVITKPGKNIKLIFKNSSGKKVLFKHFNVSQTGNILYSQPAAETAFSDDMGFFTGDILTLISVN